jgi:hypothetical protein
MQRNPGRYQRRTRSTLTFSSLASFQSRTAVVQEGSVFDDARAQALNAFNLHFRRGSFRNDKPALPILTTVQHDKSLATVCMNFRIVQPIALIELISLDRQSQNPSRLASQLVG